MLFLSNLQDCSVALTIINPSPAQSAAFFARPCDTPNSSKTATNDLKRVHIDSAEMTFATVR